MDIMDAIRKLEDIQDEVKEIDQWIYEERSKGNLKWNDVIKALEKLSEQKWNEAWNLRCKINQATEGINLD